MNCLLLHFVPAYKVGGVEIAAERAAREAGGRVRVHFLARVPGQADPEPAEAIAQAPYSSSLTLAAARRAVKEVRRSDPDVVVFSLWRSFFAFLAVRLAFPTKRCVLFLHNVETVHFVDALCNRIMKALSHAVWADSVETLEKRGAAGKHDRAISMLLHRPTARTAAAKGPSFVSWSRLSTQKRVDIALHFIAALAPLRPDVRFTVIGPDEGWLARLEELRARLGVDGQVEFVGPRDRIFIEKAAAEATFYLQTSDFEGQSMAVVEAMQLGLIPVVTPVGAIPNYSADGVSAIFFRSPEEAAARVDALLCDPAALERMAEAARLQFVGSSSYTEDVLEAAAELVAARG
jgi:glycosyltransferase involved in cell wall biosynthesis